MKKLFIKSISLILSLITLVSVMAGCNNEASGDPTNIVEYGVYEGGLHVYDKTEIADKYIVEEGRTDYWLVLPDENHSRLNLAKSDFTLLFKEATGYQIKSTNESAVKESWTAEDKYIVLGCKGLEEKAGLALNDEYVPEGKSINLDGFQIRTKGNSIFVMSQDAEGTLWGTYELITQLFNYERYGVSIYEIDKNVTTLNLYDFKISDNPDFETRIAPWGAIYDNDKETDAGRLRFVMQKKDVYVDAKRYHNALDFLSPTTYYFDESDNIQRWKWFGGKTKLAYDPENLPQQNKNVYQLCYTAHGDQVAYDAMVAQMAENALKDIVSNNNPIITITQEDNTTFCDCQYCASARNTYGGKDSGAMWKFHLDVVETINNWLDANGMTERKNSLTIAMFAYHGYQEAPAYQDENGDWHPYSDDVNGYKEGRNIANAAIFYAPCYSDFNHGLHREDYNESIVLASAGWKVCTKNIGAWLYQTDFIEYLIPTDKFNFQQNYKVLLSMGAKWIFDQGQQGNENSSGFNNFKLYLNSKLQWNVNLDFNELLDKYFNAVYGPAAETMKTYFEMIRIQYQFIEPINSVEDPQGGRDNFPFNVVNQWLDLCNQAYADLEELKTQDEDAWQVYYDSVVTESICARYCLIEYYGQEISPEAAIAEVLAFETDVLRLGFTEYGQHADINDLITAWKTKYA